MNTAALQKLCLYIGLSYVHQILSLTSHCAKDVSLLQWTSFKDRILTFCNTRTSIVCCFFPFVNSMWHFLYFVHLTTSLLLLLNFISILLIWQPLCCCYWISSLFCSFNNLSVAVIELHLYFVHLTFSVLMLLNFISILFIWQPLCCSY
jgi:hypothetical protein